MNTDNKNTIKLMHALCQYSAKERGHMGLHYKECGLSETLDSIPDAVITFDDNATINSWNKAAEKLYHYSSDEIIGRNMSELMSSEDYSKLLEKIVFLKNDNSSLHFENERIKKSGAKFFVSSSLSIYPRLKEGKFNFTLIDRDQTELQLAYNKIETAEKQLNAVLNASKQYLLLLDTDKNIIVINKLAFEATKMLRGISINPGDSIYTMLPDELHANFDSYFEIALSGKTADYDSKVAGRDGSHLWVNVTHSPVFDSNNKVISVALSILDITSRKRAEFAILKSEEELLEMNASKDKLFSIIAHDLKGAFTGLLGISGMLNKNLEDLSLNDITQYINELNSSAENLFKLLENLLHWSRLRRGLISSQAEDVEVHSVAKFALDILINNANQKNIELINDIQSDILVKADVNMLNTVLRNLLSNAIKFSNQDGNIRLLSNLDNDKMTISVQDNGIGMDQDIAESIFSLGQSKTLPGTNGEPGTGIGLILCKELIEKQNGKIWVDSKPDEGSTFSFTLPLSK